MTAPERTWETPRLLAKPAAVADAQVVFDNYASDPAVAKYMTWTPHRSVADTKEFLSRCERVWIEGSAFPWSPWYKQNGAFVGLIEVRVRAGAVDLGYALARRWWRQGLMSEAVTAVIEWALTQPTIYRVWATCDVDNAGRTGDAPAPPAGPREFRTACPWVTPSASPVPMSWTSRSE